MDGRATPQAAAPLSRPGSLRRSFSDLGPPLKEGHLLRESTVVHGVVNRREAELYETHFVTYRRKRNPATRKAWVCTAACRLSPVEERAMSIADNRHTVLAVMSGNTEHKTLHCFTVQWPEGDTHQPHLTLCFEATADAEAWHVAFAGVLGRLKRSSDGGGATAEMSEAAARLAAGGGGRSGAWRSFSAAQSGKRHSYAPSEVDASAAPDLLECEMPTDEARPEELGDDQDIAGPSHKWASYRYIDGISIYTERPEDGDEGPPALMLSMVVRAPPEMCMKALMLPPKAFAATGATTGISSTVLERVDDNTQILRNLWTPSGAFGSLFAPREVVWQRSWRKEGDGTFIVLYTSTEHPRARQRSGSWWDWHHPVRAQVVACGYTCSPLMHRFTADGSSAECLVTAVMKIDFGGWLSAQHPAAAALYPFSSLALEAWTRSLVQASVLLREAVEQERFVVRPTQLSREEGGPDGDLRLSEPSTTSGNRSSGSTGGGRQDRGLSRSATFRMRSYHQDSQRRLSPGATPPDTPTAGERAALLQRNKSIFVPRMSMVGVLPTVPSSQPATPPEVAPYVETGTLSPVYWSCPGAAGYKLRGPNYFKDRKKVAAEEPAFALASIDLVELDQPTFHIAQHLPSIKHSQAPFTFVVQIMVPRHPPLSLTAAWSADYDVSHLGGSDGASTQGDGGDSDADAEISPFDLALARFLAGHDADPDTTKRRNATFKLIPHVVKGSWVVKQSVGATPVLLGQKLTTKYFRGPKYMEVDIDVSSSSVAASVVGLVSGATRSLTVDMGILLQSNEADELPERLLGTMRLTNLDLSQAAYLDTATGKVHPKHEQ